MKIVLIYPIDRDFMSPSMPPLGLAYIAATLDKEGHEVTVIDLNSDRENGLAQLTDTLLHKDFDLIGISSIITQYKKVKELGKFIKSILPDKPLIMGGTGPTSVPEIYLKNCFADIVCLGEGEEIIKELVLALENARPLESCKGIAFKNRNGLVIITPKMEPIKNQDTIAFPAWNKFNSIDTYLDNYLFKIGRKRGISLLSSRGCPGHCNYCMCNFGRKIRSRSAENIFQEIKILVNNYQVEHIHFVDDTLITTPERTSNICAVFKKFDNLTWSANVRADFVNQEMLQHMAAAKCIFLAYGIESASPIILKFMRKNITPLQASNAIKWTREAGISLRAYFIIGMPPETPQTIRETVDFCKEYLVGGEFFFATPFPGTELYQYAKDNNFIRNEDLYLEHIGEVRNFIINLTSMSNEELFTLKENAERQIKEHLARHNIEVSPSIRIDPRETAAILPKF